MDLRTYYQRIRELTAQLTEEYVAVVSSVTNDGGKAGVITEVTRHNAAHLVVDLRARLATTEEAEQFRLDKQEKVLEADRLASVSRLQVTVVPEKIYRLLEPNGTEPKGTGTGKKTEA